LGFVIFSGTSKMASVQATAMSHEIKI